MKNNENSNFGIPPIGGTINNKEEYQNTAIFLVNITWANLTYSLN